MAISKRVRSWLVRAASDAAPMDDGGSAMPAARLHRRPMQPTLGESQSWDCAAGAEAYTGTVYTCVNAIAARVARAAVDAKLMLERPDGEKVPVDRSHPVSVSMRRPNEDWTDIAMWMLTVQHRQLCGDAYWAKLRGPAGRIVGYWPLYPQITRKVVSVDGGSFIRGVNYYPDGLGGERFFFERRDLVIFKKEGPTPDVYGWPTLKAAAYAKNAADAAAIWESDWFKNQCRPDAIIGAKVPPGEAGSALMRRIIARIKRHGRVPGEPLALPAEISYNVVQHDLASMQWIELQGLKQRDIESIFGVNRYIANRIDEVGDRSQIDGAKLIFAEGTLLTELEQICADLRKDLLDAEEYVPRESGARLYFDYGNVVPEDEAQKFEQLHKALTASPPGITQDEFRERAFGLPPYEPGKTPGSVLWVPFGQVPQDETLLEDALGLTADPGEAPPDEDEDRAALPAATAELPEILPRAALAFRARGLGSSAAARTKYWKETMSARRRHEARGERAVKAAFAAQERRIVASWRKNGGRLVDRMEGMSDVRKRMFMRSAEARGVLEDLGIWDEEREDQELAKAIERFTRVALGAAAKRAAALIDIDFDAALTPRAVKWLKSHANRTAAYANEVTRKQINRTIADGVADGLSVSDIAASLTDRYKRFSGPRALLIARTETAVASERGQLEAWSEGVAKKVLRGWRWITSRDESVRKTDGDGNPPGHEIDGEVAEVGSRFSNGMRYPADEQAPMDMRANERCTTAPVVRGEDEAADEAEAA